MSKRIVFSCLAIILLGFGLRFFRLGEVPVGFHRDEAFLGYNAYSLLRTGRDMSGHFLPLHFESFIYSPGGYSYLAIPSIFLFGLNPYSVRFPAAFLGSLTILLLYFVTRNLFPKSSKFLGLVASFFLAITPWHINLSRTTTESVPVVFFISLGVLLFVLWNKQKNYLFLIASFISFAITLTMYQAPRAFLPLFLPLLILLHIDVKKYKFTLIPFLCYLLLIILPVIGILSSPALATRMKTVGIWSTEETKLTVAEQIREDGVMHIPAKLSRLIHNKFIGYGEVFLKNYFAHLSYDFLFTDKGLPDRYRVPDSGLLYLSMLPFVLIGLVVALSRYPRQGGLLVGWILLAIVGSALTFDDVPNLQRTLLVFPALTMLMALGCEYIYFHKNKRVKFFVIAMFALGFTFEGYRYLHHYYIQQLVHRPWYRQEGYQTLVQDIQTRKQDYDKVIVTNRESAPTIFFLFFTSYDPQAFQDETRNSKLRDFDRVNFATYMFSTEECPLKEVHSIDPKTQKESIDCYVEPKTLYVNSGVCKLPTVCANILKVVKRNDDTSVFEILDRSQAAASLSGSLK